MRVITSTAIIATLAACGGSDGSGVNPVATRTFAPISAFTGASAVTTYDATADEYTVQRMGVRHTLPANPTFDIGTFDAGENGMGIGVFSSETGASSIRVSVFSGEASPTTVRMRRITPTTVPVTGTTTLNGDYIGVITNMVSNDVDLLVSGDAEVTFDFGSATNTGGITNRVVRDPTANTVVPGIAVADLVFEDGIINNTTGGFSGGAQGGSIDATTQIGAPTFLGRSLYSGYITGDTGDEAIGSVRMIHNVVGGGDLRQEAGAMALGH